MQPCQESADARLEQQCDDQAIEAAWVEVERCRTDGEDTVCSSVSCFSSESCSLCGDEDEAEASDEFEEPWMVNAMSGVAHCAVVEGEGDDARAFLACRPAARLHLCTGDQPVSPVLAGCSEPVSAKGLGVLARSAGTLLKFWQKLQVFAGMSGIWTWLDPLVVSPSCSVHVRKVGWHMWLALWGITLEGTGQTSDLYPCLRLRRQTGRSFKKSFVRCYFRHFMGPRPKVLAKLNGSAARSASQMPFQSMEPSGGCLGNALIELMAGAPG